MNLAEELKARILIEDVVSRYWEEVDRFNRVRCFVHNGKDKNMLVNNGFAYCFVCNANHDIISTVQHLFNLDFIQACEKLNNDFDCGLPIGRKLTAQEYAKIKNAEEKRKMQKKAKKERENKERELFIQVCDEMRRLERLLDKLQPPTPCEAINLDDERIDKIFTVVKRLEWLNWIADILTQANNDCEWTYTVADTPKKLYNMMISGELKKYKI